MHDLLHKAWRAAWAAALLIDLTACEPPRTSSTPSTSSTPAATPAETGNTSHSRDIVATLNGEPLSRELLDHLVSVRRGSTNPYDLQSAGAPAPAEAANRQDAMEELLTIELLAQQARARGLDHEPALRAERALQQKSLLAQMVVREAIGQIELSESELRAAYDTQVPANEYRLSQILLPDESAATSALHRLQQGEAFADVAKQVSTDLASRDRGGDLGWLMHEQLPPALAAAASQLKPAQTTSRPIHSDLGWHVLMLRELRPAPARPSFETAQVWLHPQLVHAKVQAQQRQWREQAQIQIASTP